MHTVNTSQESREKDGVWVLLAEYSPDEFIPLAEGRGEFVARLLFQELGMPPECLDQVIWTLADFAQQAMTHAHPATPAVVRLFCQEKMFEAGNRAETIRLKLTVARPEIILPAPPKMSGGWGYFIIEKTVGSASPAEKSHPFVDLYLYKEGE